MTRTDPSPLLLDSTTERALEEQVVRGFFAHRIAIVNAREPFTLASGARSPVYLDHRRAFSVPGLREQLTRLWASRVASMMWALPSFEGSEAARDPASLVVAGTATAGIAPAYALASALGARFVYVRSKPKAHGLGRMLEGAWEPGSRCIVVDDMVTTGGSLLEAASLVRAEGGVPAFATSVTRHPFARTDAAFADAQLPLVACFASPELFTRAAELGLVDAASAAAALDWIGAQGGAQEAEAEQPTRRSALLRAELK